MSGSISQRTPLSYFERVLQKCGIILSQSLTDNSYVLGCDHMEFVIALRSELYANPQFPENIQQFISGLQDAMKSRQHLLKFLIGCGV